LPVAQLRRLRNSLRSHGTAAARWGPMVEGNAGDQALFRYVIRGYSITAGN
jgi:hypothetical protein